ncbi:MAG: MFS transporter [Cyanobacteria bacterium P01_G01_bin.19]
MLKTLTPKNLPRNVWVLGFVSFFTDTASKIIQSLLPLFLVSVLGVNLVTVGTIEGIAESTASILKVFSGALSDYLGKRKELTIAGYGLSALVIPLFALANSASWVLLARFGDRVGKGIRVAPRNALVADATPPEQRGAAYGLRQSLDTLGAAIGPLLAVILMAVSGQNFRLLFWLATIPGIIAVLLLIFGLKEENSSRKQPKSPLRWSSLRNLDRGYWLLFLVVLIFNLGNSSDAFLLLRSQQVGISDTIIPLAFMVMNFTYFLSAYPAGVISDRLGRYGLIVVGFLIYALVYLGFAYAVAPWQIWTLFALYGLYQGMSKGLLLAAVGDRLTAELRGTGFGAIALGTGVMLFPANFIAGLLWENISYSAPFIFGSILSVVAMLLLLLNGKLSD